MKIEKIEIKGLFGKKDICWKLNPQVNVLVGVNGSGKSTILSTVFCMLTNIPNSNKSMIFDRAEIHFNDIRRKPIIRINHIKQHQINVDIDEVVTNITNQVKQETNDFLDNLISTIPYTTKNKELLEKLATYKNSFLQERIPEDVRNRVLQDVQEVDGRQSLVIKHQETNQYIDNQDIFENFNLTMISTLNLSANSIFEFKGSNEEVLNILDLEMDKVFNQFKHKSDGEIQEKLMNALNFFLNMVEKHAEYKKHTIVYFDKDIQKELKFSDLSSGERQLVYMLVQVALNSTEKEKSSIILMDEPEISLHLDWQEHFIKQLSILNSDAQFIIVTHSPALVMNGWNDVYADMEEITTWQ